MSRIPTQGCYFFICIGLSLAVLCLSSLPDAHGAAAVQRRVQQQKEIQAQMVAQYQQQVIAQQQAQQVAAYKQAAVQQQVAMQQMAYQKAAAEYAAYKQAMQVAVAKRNAELQAAEQVKALIAQKQANEVAMVQQAVAQQQMAQMVQYKQALEAKQVADQMTQAQLNQEIQQYADFMAKRQAAIQAQVAGVQQAQAVQEIAAYNQYQQVKAVQARSEVEAKMAAQQAQRAFDSRAAQTAVGASIAKQVLDAKNGYEKYQQAGLPEEPQTIVDIQDLWKALDESSEAWNQIIDAEIKVLTAAEYIDRFKKVGITIKKSPGFYANWIEAIAQEDPSYLQGPFMNVLSYAAIMEYDFDNGQNKDELARRVLGENNFRTNKARLELR